MALITGARQAKWSTCDPAQLDDVLAICAGRLDPVALEVSLTWRSR